MAGKLTFADLVQDSARLIQRMEPAATASVPHSRALTTAPLPELSIGIHEWFYGEELDRNNSGSHPKPPPRSWDRPWQPAALTMMTWMAGRILRQLEQKYLFWIGGAHFQPTIQLLAAMLPGHGLAERCIFIDPPNTSDRIWSIDQALRSNAAAAVIADGAGADMAASRRWQLAAAAGGVCGLLARPLWDMNEPCLAITRWQVTPVPTVTVHPQWRVRLLRCKPPMVPATANRQWLAQWCYDSTNGQGEMHIQIIPATPDK